MKCGEKRVCLFCEAEGHDVAFSYDAPPEGEPAYSIGESLYHREIWKCKGCGHFISIHDYDLNNLYEGDYNKTIRGDDTTSIKKTFDRINKLDPSDSDNVGRVNHVLAYAEETQKASNVPPTLLDIGSGIAVFPYRMKLAGWDCTIVDPDSQAVRHAKDNAGLKGYCGDFLKLRNLGRYDAVTLNKVLEHVCDPVEMLSRGLRALNSMGFIYVEVPDGEMAAREGGGRQEFFIDHFHIFNPDSLSLLARRSGLIVRKMKRLVEPSGKFTIRAFLTKPI